MRERDNVPIVCYDCYCDHQELVPLVGAVTESDIIMEQITIFGECPKCGSIYEVQFVTTDESVEGITEEDVMVPVH